MPSTYTKDWAAIFNKANVAFSKDVSELRKVEATASSILKSELDAMHKSLPPAMSAMEAFDKINLTVPGLISDADKRKAANKQFDANVKEAGAVLVKLQSTVKKSVAEIAPLVDFKLTTKEKTSDIRLPKPLKMVCPETYRQLKVMRAALDDIAARAANDLKMALNASKIAAIEAAKNAQKAKVAGADDAAQAKLKAISEEAAMKQFKLAFATGMKAAMAKGATRIQKLKATPDAATYNEEMNYAGRDISQNLLNLTKLRADAKFKSSSLVKKLPDPAPFATQLAAFANGNKRQIAPTAAKADVQKLVAEFTDLYKRIGAAYKDVMAGKFG